MVEQAGISLVTNPKVFLGYNEAHIYNTVDSQLKIEYPKLKVATQIEVNRIDLRAYILTFPFFSYPAIVSSLIAHRWVRFQTQ